MAEITEREQRQIDQANSSGKTPVVFIHGLWLLPSSWDKWGWSVRGARLHGCNALKAGRLGNGRGSPRQSRGLREETLRQVADHTAQVIGQLDKKPAVMGHSTGGLLTYMIADRGLSIASVAIDPGRSEASCPCRCRR